jgi:prevent-host-death family protein
MEVNIHEAKTQLSKLIQRALAGEEVTIAKAGQPLVRLVRVEPQRPVLGSARGTMKLRKGWDKPLTKKELGDLFAGDVFPS